MSAGLGEGVKRLVVPPIWRIERCTKHENYVPDCCLCNEEILTIKTEKAYRAGVKAALEAAARLPAPDDYNLAVERCVDFLMREADANFLPNEPLKMLIKGLVIAMRAALATPSPQAPAATEITSPSWAEPRKTPLVNWRKE